jgi:hypothetical protein
MATATATRICIVDDCTEPVGPGTNRARCNPHRLELQHARRDFDRALAELHRLKDHSWRTRQQRGQ